MDLTSVAIGTLSTCLAVIRSSGFYHFPQGKLVFILHRQHNELSFFIVFGPYFLLDSTVLLVLLLKPSRPLLGGCYLYLTVTMAVI